ncbi:unnamed protein product, partial [Ilex paraguariensis]
AWRLWTEERTLELIDTSVEDSCILPEIFRFIHVGLLCVQQLPHDRPNMLLVVMMLSVLCKSVLFAHNWGDGIVKRKPILSLRKDEDGETKAMSF